MRNSARDPEAMPRPEVLVAYVDGQLEPQATQQVEVALATSLAGQTLVEDHRHVLQTIREAPLPEPSAEAWERTFENIAGAVLSRDRRVLTNRRRLGWRTLATAAAAALLLALPGELGLRPEAPLALAEVVPFPVAAAQDVEIVSIDSADLKSLLVGQPPLRGLLELAGAGDVLLHFTELDEHSWVPEMERQEGVTPIFMVPMRTGGSDKP
jgi:anti-sigma factor RsiW